VGPGTDFSAEREILEHSEQHDEDRCGDADAGAGWRERDNPVALRVLLCAAVGGFHGFTIVASCSRNSVSAAFGWKDCSVALTLVAFSVVSG